MSSNNSASTIDLSPRPSVGALKWVFALHAVPLCLAMFAMPPGIPAMLVAMGFGISWLWLRRHPALGFGPRALVRMVWHAEGRWTIYNAGGNHADAELMRGSYVHPRLLVLSFRLPSGKRRTRILLGDEVSADLLRRLRARLSTSENGELR